MAGLTAVGLFIALILSARCQVASLHLPFWPCVQQTPPLITPLVHPSKLRCFLFAPTQTPPLTACLVHPIELHRFILAPCVIQTPSFCVDLYIHQSCISYLLSLPLYFYPVEIFWQPAVPPLAMYLLFALRRINWGWSVTTATAAGWRRDQGDNDWFIMLFPRCENTGKKERKTSKKVLGGNWIRTPIGFFCGVGGENSKSLSVVCLE